MGVLPLAFLQGFGTSRARRPSPKAVVVGRPKEKPKRQWGRPKRLGKPEGWEGHTRSHWEEMARQLRTHLTQKLARILAAFVFNSVENQSSSHKNFPDRSG